MLQKLMVNLRSLGANKHAETLVQTGSERFSPTTNLNIFVGGLVTLAAKNIAAPLSDQFRSP
jgi:hypothetical protein